MSKVYYISKIRKFENRIEEKIIRDTDGFYNSLGLTPEEKYSLTEYIHDYYKDPEAFKNFDQESLERIENVKERLIPFEPYDYSLSNYIIYEIITDKDGFTYGKELITGELFPIINKKNTTYENELLSKNYLNRNNFVLYIHRKYSYNNPNIAKLYSIIFEPDASVASVNDVENYLNKFDKGLFKKAKKEKFIKNITYLSKENTYNNEIVIDVPEIKVRTKQNGITKSMENIDYLLNQIKKIDSDLYTSKKNEYEEIINNEEKNELTLNPFALDKLKIFESELEFIIKFNKKQDNDIINYLNNLLSEYEEGKVTELTIEDIDKLNELFLNMQSNYSAIVARKVLVTLSYLYIYEIYENKDTITLKDLENSYFNDNLKTILLNLNKMIDEGIIENNILINFDEEPNAKYILDSIKNIKFNNLNKDKQKTLK